MKILTLALQPLLVASLWCSAVEACFSPPTESRRNPETPGPSDQPPAILKLADGTRFFPIGLSALPGGKPTESGYKQAIEAGFNVVTDHPGQGRLKRVLTLPTRPLEDDGSNGYPALDLSVEPQTARKTLDAFLTAHEDDTDLAFWQGPDESNYFPFSPRRYPSADGLEAGYRYVREQSRHPVWSNLGPTGTAAEPANLNANRPLLPSSDAWSIDIYPVPNDQNYQESPFHQFGLSQGGQFAKTLRKQLAEEGHAEKPVWMWLQGFGWSDFKRPGWEGRRPTYDEARFMTFDAVINGATGILYYGTGALEPDSQYWADLRKVASELNDLLPALMGRAVEVTTDQPQVEACVRITESGKLCLIAANASEKKIQSAKIAFESRDARLAVRGQARTVPMSQGVFHEDFEPYAVHVYQAEP